MEDWASALEGCSFRAAWVSVTLAAELPCHATATTIKLPAVLDEANA